MIVKNRRLLENVPFEEYLKMPGLSHSDIKNDFKKIAPTARMQLGTDVHNYLLTPGEYKGQSLHLVKPAAAAIKAEIGPLLPFLRAELVVQADFIYQGQKMLFRGRGDLVIPDKLVIDIKVSEMPLNKSVYFFGYDNQQSGYALAFGAKASLIIAVNPKKALRYANTGDFFDYPISMYRVPISPNWWAAQVLKFGKFD